MQFTPKTDAQFVQEEKERKEKYLWPSNSICDYEVNHSLEKIGDYGNYIELGLTIYNDKGEKQTIKDFLGGESKKLKQYCEANSIDYDAGNIEEHQLDGKSGKCMIGVRKGKKKDDGTFYGDSNNIISYLKPAGTKAKSDLPFDDDIPF